MEEDLPARVRVMQNAVVLKLIAKKMPLEDLRPLRQTCPLWNQFFVPAVRDKQGVMKLRCVVNQDIDQTKTMRNYTELMRTSQEIPVSKYSLEDVDAARYYDIKAFFDLCGSSTRRFDFDLQYDGNKGWTTTLETVETIQKIRRIIFERSPNLEDVRLIFDRDNLNIKSKKTVAGDGRTLARDLPNLRKLRFCVIKDGEPDTEEWHPVIKSLFADLVRHATGLKSFSCRPSSVSGTWINNVEVLSVLRDHASPSCINNLTSIKIGNLDVADLELLVELGNRRQSAPLRLRALFISLKYNDERGPQIMRKLCQFLTTQANTLRHFSLDIRSDQVHWDDLQPWGWAPGPGGATIQLPTMPLMRRFCLNRENLDSGHLPENEPLAVKLPGLVSFEYLYNHSDYSGDDVDDMDGFGHTSVTDLRLDTNFQLVPGDADIFQRIYGAGFQFQLVTRLEIWLKASRQYILTQVFSAMPSLEVLQVAFRFRAYANYDEDADLVIAGLKSDDTMALLELDSLLSGVSRNNLGVLRQDLAQLEAQANGLTVGTRQNALQNRKTEPGLQDLHHLKKLVIAIDSGSYSYRLTNAGGYLALALASPTIQHIEIGPGLNIDVEDNQKEGYIKTGQNGWSQSVEGGVLLSEHCQAVIRSVMSPPAILLI